MGKPIILFEDSDLIAINKPSGMIVNNADTTKAEETVQDWVKNNYQFPNVKNQDYQTEKTNSGEGENMYDPIQEFYNRGGIVHRLDKETSGVLLIAKNPQSFALLKQQFMQRRVKKTYLALAHGLIAPDTGSISAPLGRLEFNRKRFGVVAEGREAETQYQVIKQYQLHTKNQTEKLTLVELKPQTGRTHQIRVHLKHIGHPIFSDELYAGRKTARDDRRYLSRLFLHASKISFIHPTTKKEITFEVPLPIELEAFIGKLEKTV